MMRFENKNKKLLPFPQFLFRVLRFFLFSLVLILVSVLVGTLGYRYYADLSWLDAFYNACMILTGMGPVSIMSNNAAKIFSSFYALFSGIAFLSTVAIIFTPIVHRFLHMLHIDD